MLRNVSDPSLTVFTPAPAKANGAGTVVAQDDRTLFTVVDGLYADWSSADLPAELHIFTCGGHGFASASAGCPWTAGPICQETGWRIRGSPKSSTARVPL
jgi:hypothetical protein